MKLFLAAIVLAANTLPAGRAIRARVVIMRFLVVALLAVLSCAGIAVSAEKRVLTGYDIRAASSSLTAQTQSDEDSPLGKAAKIVLATGNDINLAGQLSTALGVTTNKQTFPMKQKLIDTPGYPAGSDALRQTFNVSRVRGRLDIIIFYRTPTEGWLYLTSVHGYLEKAIHGTKTTIEELPFSTAVTADFEKEKACG